MASLNLLLAMPLEAQNLIVYGIVLLILGGLVGSIVQRARQKKKPGCGPDCGCDTGVKRNPVIQKLVDERQDPNGS